MPSGKQILLSILTELSQKHSDNLVQATDRVNPAMLVHASTAVDTWYTVEKHAWISEEDTEYNSVRQGLGLKESGVFLSDLFECIADSPEIASRVKDKFPNLSEGDYEDATTMIWQLLSALQYYSDLAPVENQGVLDLDERDRYISSYLTKLNYHREDPDGYHKGDYPLETN